MRIVQQVFHAPPEFQGLLGRQRGARGHGSPSYEVIPGKKVKTRSRRCSTLLKEATEICHQGWDLQNLQGDFTSSPQTSKHVNRGAVGKSLICKVCNLKANTLTWIQDAKLVKRKSLVHMIDMQAQKTHQVGNLNTSDISLAVKSSQTTRGNSTPSITRTAMNFDI